MKKFGLLLVILLSVTLLSGCLTANSVTLIEDYGKYEELLDAYPYTNTGTFLMFNGQDEYDLYSGGTYSPNLYSAIHTGTNESFAFLDKGNEYEVMLSGAMNFFYTYGKIYLTLAANNDRVPQDARTELYHALEDLESKTNTVYHKKQDLENFCRGGTDPNSITVKNALQTYLNSYQDLIGSAIRFDLVFEDICLNYLSLDAALTNIPSGGIPRLVLSAELHVTDYLYQRYMVNTTSAYTNFRTTDLFVTLTSLQTNFDLGTADYDSLETDATAILYYNQAVEILSHFEAQFANYYESISQIPDDQTVSQEDELYPYYQFAIQFETTVATFADIALTLLNMAIPD